MISITFYGRLGRDAELKRVGDYDVCEFSIATDRKVKGEEITTWLNCKLWGTRGVNITPHLTKGKGLVIAGSLEPREYTTNDGEHRTALDVNVDNVTFARGGGETTGSSPSAGSQQGPAPSGQDGDDSIPF